MAVFFFLTATLVAVGAIVFFLRRQQDRATTEYAERHQPLPPLQPPELEPETPETATAGHAADNHGESTSAVTEEFVAAEQAPQVTPPSRDWLKECQRLRNEGRLEEAMALSDQAFPQLQALEQKALILRARLREARLRGDEEATRHWLDSLYLAAARASCLHDAPSPDRPDSPRRMADVIDHGRLEEMEMPYREIGHEKLRLLRKTDRQLLESLYGEPLRHISAREWHHL